MSKIIQAHIMLFMVSLIYAGNYTVAKEVMPDYIQPFGFILMRGLTGAILFAIVHWLFIKEKIARQDIFQLALCGLFGVAINQLAFFKGLNWTTPINASLIMLTTPVLVLIISVIMLRERMTWLKITGVVISLIGAAFLIMYGKPNIPTVGDKRWLGDFLILVNASSYGIYLVLVKSMMKKYHPLTVVKWSFFFGLLVIIPFGLGEFTQIQWDTFHKGIWLAVFYVLIFVTFFTYFFNITALRTVNASVVSTYIYLQPLLATFIALLAGRDTLSSVKIFAGMLIFMGVFMVSYRPSSLKTANTQ